MQNTCRELAEKLMETDNNECSLRNFVWHFAISLNYELQHMFFTPNYDFVQRFRRCLHTKRWYNVLAIAAKHRTHGEDLQKTSNSNAYQTLVTKHSTNAISIHSTNAISKTSLLNTCRELAKNLRKPGINKRSPRSSAWHLSISEVTTAATNRKL